MSGPYAHALTAALAEPALAGWAGLSFFRSGAAARVWAKVDARVAAGARVLPAPGAVLNALRFTPLDKVRVVLLGQDPYPTPGDAHGLAFSYVGPGRLPASLRNIFAELAADMGGPLRRKGDLADWARQGVLLLNTALTVEAGAAGAHMAFGWKALADEALSAVSRTSPGAVFLLWGNPAQRIRPLIDETRHHVIASAHPSPLSARRGFFGSKPFSRTNAWLQAKGLAPIDWH